jgi:type III secretion protein Q
MTAPALHLRHVTQAHARTARRLASAPWMSFSVRGKVARLALRTSRRASAANSLHWFDSALGPLGFSAAQPVLNALSSCPAFANASAEESWLWPLYNAGLSAELSPLLGTLEPSTGLDPSETEWVFCELTLQLDEGRIDSVLALSADALAYWLDQPVWNANPPDHSALTLSFALRLGRLSLPRQTLAALRPGDVICPSEADFDTAGFGVVNMGPRRVQVRVGEQPDRLQLEVLEIEERTVADRDELDEPIAQHTDAWADDDSYADEANPQSAYEEQAGADADADPYYDDAEESEQVEAEEDEYNDPVAYAPQPAEPPTPTEAFADLAMPLTLRCGQIRLTLGELAALAPGAILEVPGITPGMAGLYYGERRLALGELVDVEGRLGLQITQLDERG